jgi:hypothetical protein
MKRITIRKMHYRDIWQGVPTFLYKIILEETSIAHYFEATEEAMAMNKGMYEAAGYTVKVC